MPKEIKMMNESEMYIYKASNDSLEQKTKNSVFLWIYVVICVYAISSN